MSLSDSQLTSQGKVPLKVSLRTLTGVCHPSNRRAIQWSHRCGLLAYASHGSVVILDPVSCQVVQTLDGHKCSVNRLAWTQTGCQAKHLSDRLTLATADVSGKILVWNVNSGEVKARLQDTANGGVSSSITGTPTDKTSNSNVGGLQTVASVLDMTWLDGRFESSGHLLLALHWHNSLVLWDTAKGVKVWKMDVSMSISSIPATSNIFLGFDHDPFDAHRLVLRSSNPTSIVFIEDFKVNKQPTKAGHLQLGILKACSSGVSGGTGNDAGGATRGLKASASMQRMQKVRSKMLELVTMNEGGGNGPSGSDGSPTPFGDCIQTLFHACARNHIFMVFPRLVLIVDLEIHQPVGVIHVEKSSANIIQALACSQRDAIYLLHENGCVSLRVRKGLYNLAHQPRVGNSPSPRPTMSNIAASQTPSVGSQPATPSRSDSGHWPFFSNDSSDCGEVIYESKALSEPIRLTKNGRVLGFAINNITESNLAVWTSEGKIYLLELQQDDSSITPRENTHYSYGIEDLIQDYQDATSNNGKDGIKVHTDGIISGLAAPPFVTRMCPPMTLKNMEEYVPRMAIGSSNGNIQIVDMSTGRVEREFANHTYPVQGIEWTSLHTVLSFAHQNSSGGADIRNELIHTDVRTGMSKSLRAHRSEEPAIDMIRVSHLKQYFIVAFVGAPFELWDLTTLSLLRTMPKKFPPITALDWSPLHNMKHLKKKEREKQEAANNETANSPEAAQGGDTQSDKTLFNNNKLVAKEHFVFTDPEGQLYHFSVEGNSIKDGTKIDAESSLGTVTCIAWKSDHVVRGDADGNMNIWDLKTKSTKNISTGKRGSGSAVKKIRFAPGKGNMKLLVLTNDSVSIHDVKTGELINEIKSPKDLVSKPSDIGWAASDRPVIATQDGCLRIMSLALSGSTSSLMDYEESEPMACHSLLASKARNNFETLLHPQPWKESSGSRNWLHPEVEDGFTNSSEVDRVSQLIELMDERAVQCLQNSSVPTTDKLFLASKLCGLKWESEFWQVAASTFPRSSWKDQHSLGQRYDLLVDNTTFFNWLSERQNVHESRCIAGPGVGTLEPQMKKSLLSRMICMGSIDKAVKILLESSDPSDPSYYEDNLRACLVSSYGALVNSSSGAGGPSLDSQASTVKLVATNLIAEGKLWEGVELLCLIDKVSEACQYLQASNEWYASVWLAKCRLTHADQHDQLTKIIGKFSDHLMTEGLRQEAILVQLSCANYIGVLDMLLAGKMIVLAFQFLSLVRDELGLIDPDTSHVIVVSEEIHLACARYAYFECGNSRAAFYHCDRADEKGEILKKEIQTLASSSSPLMS